MGYILGAYYYADGDQYDGDWKYNSRHGKGKVYKYYRYILLC